MKDLITFGLKDVLRNKTTNEILKLISLRIWAKIEFAKTRKGLKIFETSVTQDILQFMMLAASQSKFDIKLFEAKSEKTNGNDIECFIETNEGYILFPIQSKIIYSDFKYRKISHKVRGVEQIDILLNYAKKKGGFPLYFFYNYYNDKPYLENMKNTMGFDFRLYGISFLDESYTKLNCS